MGFWFSGELSRSSGTWIKQVKDSVRGIPIASGELVAYGKGWGWYFTVSRVIVAWVREVATRETQRMAEMVKLGNRLHKGGR